MTESQFIFRGPENSRYFLKGISEVLKHSFDHFQRSLKNENEEKKCPDFESWF